MKKLLKSYGLQSDLQYFEMIADSFTNGQISQAYDQFEAMPKQQRRTFVKSALNNWNSGISTKRICELIDFI